MEVARPIEKNRKRALDDPQSKPASKMSSHSKISKDEQTLTTFGGIKSGALELKYSLEVDFLLCYFSFSASISTILEIQFCFNHTIKTYDVFYKDMLSRTSTGNICTRHETLRF